MDTARNPKILMAERCIKDLARLLTGLKGVGRETSKLVNAMEAKILEIKYSYGELGGLKPLLSELNSHLLEFYNALGGNQWVSKLRKIGVDNEKIAQIKFAMNIIYNLEPRLKLPDDPAYAVDIRVGEIESVMKHPNADKLKVCNVNVGKVITVVTNDLSVKPGEKVAVSLLPPANLRGVVSEGMFVGYGKGVSRKDGHVGTLPRLNEEELNSIRKEVLNYLR